MADKSKSHVLDAHPFQVLDATKTLIGDRRICVAISGGKDSSVIIDLCRRYFPAPDQIVAYFCYYVPNLEFQDRYLRYLERRYSIAIQRLPAPSLSRTYKTAIFRHPTTNSVKQRKIGIRDIENYMRATTGAILTATGEKTRDSIERCAQIKRHGGIDHSRHRFYPIAYWTDSQVYAYLKQHQIPLPTDYHLFQQIKQLGNTGRRKRLHDHNFAIFNPDHLILIRDRYPEDYRRILEYFPLLEAHVMRREIERARILNSDSTEATESSNGKEEISQQASQQIAGSQ